MLRLKLSILSGLIFALNLSAQTINSPTLSESSTSLGLPGGANRTRSFMYDNENAKVVISEGANSKFYWENGIHLHLVISWRLKSVTPKSIWVA